MMPQHVRRRAEDHARWTPLAADDVVGDEAVAAEHELDGALALADATLAEQQEPDAEDIDQHAVKRCRWRELLVEQCVERVDRSTRARIAHEERRRRRLGGLDDRARALVSTSDDDAGETERE